MIKIKAVHLIQSRVFAIVGLAQRFLKLLVLNGDKDEGITRVIEDHKQSHFPFDLQNKNTTMTRRVNFIFAMMTGIALHNGQAHAIPLSRDQIL